MIATNEAVESFYPYIYPIYLPTWCFQQTLGIPINNDDLKGFPNWFMAYQSNYVCSIYTHMIYQLDSFPNSIPYVLQNSQEPKGALDTSNSL